MLIVAVFLIASFVYLPKYKEIEKNAKKDKD